MSERGEHPLDYLPELALGALAEPDATPVRAHLAACEVCRGEYEEMQAVVNFLPHAAGDVSPSPALKGRLMERIQQEPPLRLPLPIRSRRGRVFALAATAAALLILAGGAGFLAGRNGGGGDDDGALISRQARLLEAAARGTVNIARGQQEPGEAAFVHAPGANDGFFWADGLPSLPPGRAYQAWFSVDGTQFEPSEVFREGASGVWLSAGAPIDAYSVVAFTIEDSDGATQPTAPPFLIVDLKKPS